MCNKLMIGYNYNYFENGVKAPLNWDYVHNAHIIIFGSTGSGKTYCSKLLLARIGLHLPKAVVTVCDFKADDFKFLSDSPNYYGFMRCTEGFNKFLTEKINVPKSEYFLPFQIDELIKKGEKQVEVLVAEDKWYGMTYKEDKPVVKAAIADMTKNGLYDGI